jgi:hypothetical protein
MRNLAALTALAVLSLAACGGSPSSPEQRSRDAMPSSDTVKVGAPPASTADQGGPTRAGALTVAVPGATESTAGDHSTYYDLTRGMAGSVNGGVLWTLTLIAQVTLQPPTSCSGDDCTWGPGSGALDPIDWKLEVRYDATGDQYAYTLSGRAKAGGDGAFHAVVSGTAKPSALPHRGTGTFTVDFDQGRLLNPSDSNVGKLVVTYSNATPGKAHVGATFLGVKDDSHLGVRLNAAYAFDEDASGGGSLDVAFRNLTTLDTTALHSRWLATGAGRGDVQVHLTSGALTFDATVTECWASAAGAAGQAAFSVTWFHTSDAAHLGADSGAQAACAFQDASPSQLTAP